MRTFTEKDIKLNQRSRTSHKGQNGRVLVVGGSIDYTGAPAFVGLSAMRTGADLATIAAPERAAWAIAEFSPNLITKKLKGNFLDASHVKTCLECAERADVVVLGNGIGLRRETRTFVHRFLEHLEKPVIIDADAIKLIALDHVHNAIITPHGGELQQLLDNTSISMHDLPEYINNNILVCKGHPETKIISKKQTLTTKTGHPGMTCGGTGDVLAGMIAGLIAQGNDPLKACATATFINGKVGETLAKTHGVGYLASDFLYEIPTQFKRYIK